MTKDEPTCERLWEWVGVTDDHSRFLTEGNLVPGYENLKLTTFDSLLSFGNMLRVANRYTMQTYCKKWNDIVRKRNGDFRQMLVHPEKAEFALTIPFDGRRRETRNERKASFRTTGRGTTFDELNAEQRLTLKQRMLDEELYETEGRGASHGELAEADSLVSDEKLRKKYEGTTFVEEDFP